MGETLLVGAHLVLAFDDRYPTRHEHTPRFKTGPQIQVRHRVVIFWTFFVLARSSGIGLPEGIMRAPPGFLRRQSAKEALHIGRIEYKCVDRGVFVGQVPTVDAGFVRVIGAALGLILSKVARQQAVVPLRNGLPKRATSVGHVRDRPPLRQMQLGYPPKELGVLPHMGGLDEIGGCLSRLCTARFRQALAPYPSARAANSPLAAVSGRPE